jgi:hypothetical protein
VTLIRVPARRYAKAVAVPLGLLMLAGCAWGGGGGESPNPSEAQLDTISAEIEDELAQRDDVQSADLIYNNNLTVSGTASVDVRMTPGADPQVIHDDAVRLVWESRLNPLKVISINVIDPVEPQNGVSSSLSLSDDAAREPLEKKYGPHPE